MLVDEEATGLVAMSMRPSGVKASAVGLPTCVTSVSLKPLAALELTRLPKGSALLGPPVPVVPRRPTQSPRPWPRR